ncbi:MAG: dockerin type I repeat-containing protein, partial [Clostridia bacterium]|nr:dockerin type I repeat-containing protein [Clostridia bacterium]
VRFEMLDSRIASVNILTGEVVAKATGTTQLIAYTASGSVDYINVTVTKADGVPSQITSGTLNIDQSARLVSGISIGTTVQTLINSVNEKNYVAVYKGGTKQSNTTPLATGMTLALVINGNVVKQYEIAVTGDTNCDGSLGPGDAVLVLRHLSGLQTLSGAVLKAADLNKDNSIGPGDAVTILRAIG